MKKIQDRLIRTTLALGTGAILLVPTHLLAMGPEDAPEAVTIDSMVKIYKPVEFNHLKHVKYASCEECHHHTTGVQVKDPNCIKCHAHTPEADEVSCSGCHAADRFSGTYLREMDDPHLYHIDKPGLKGAYHLNCISCHVITAGPTGCRECHAITDYGEKLFNSGKYAPALDPKSGKTHSH